MKPIVRTFDVFDTLIARRCVRPQAVATLLEDRFEHSGLSSDRIAADIRLCERGLPFTLADIWREVGRIRGWSDAGADKFAKAEFQVELEQVIPIRENMALVRDGNILVSDTYLSHGQVMALLRRAGLKRHVGLVVSNAGKHTGSAWPELLSRVQIAQHFGDNPHSDGKTPTEAGIRAVIYTGAGLTPVEKMLQSYGWNDLASLIREVRLANPFASGQSERHLWWLTCQLNVPLLVLSSVLLERHVRATASAPLLFVSRDCWLWQLLYRRLFPSADARYFFTSRLCLLKGSEEYKRYFLSQWNPGAMVVDLSSTGASWSHMFASLGQRGRLFVIAHADNSSYLPGANAISHYVDLEAVLRSSETGSPLSKALEMLNYAPHGSVEDVIALPGGDSLPVLAQELEYDPSLTEAARQSFSACLDAMQVYGDVTASNDVVLAGLIRELLGAISADAGLPAVYPNHFAADFAYERRLMG